MNIDWFAGGGDRIYEVHSILQLLLVRGMKNIYSGELKEVDAELLPAGELVGEHGQLVVLVHRHNPADILSLHHLFRVSRSEGKGTEDNCVVYSIIPAPLTDNLHAKVVGEGGQVGDPRQHPRQVRADLFNHNSNDNVMSRVILYYLYS